MNIWEWSDIKRKNGIQYVNDDKGDHQHQDGVGGSGLWGASVVSSGGVNIRHPLAVSVQKHHGATGLDHEAKKHGIRDEPQGDRAIGRIWGWAKPHSLVISTVVCVLWGQETRHQRWTTRRQGHRQDLRMSKTAFLGYHYGCVCSVEQRFSGGQWCTFRDWTSSRCSRKNQWPWGPFLWASSTLLSSGWEWRSDRFSGRRWNTGQCWESLSVSNTEFTSKTRQGVLWHKSCHCVENAKSEKNQETGHGHVGENHVCGYLLVAKKDWRDAV